MSERTIPQRELRAHIGAILREVEAGNTVKVTVSGRPVARIVPIEERRAWATRDEIAAFAKTRKPDPTFRKEIRAILDQTIDEL